MPIENEGRLRAAFFVGAGRAARHVADLAPGVRHVGREVDDLERDVADLVHGVADRGRHVSGVGHDVRDLALHVPGLMRELRDVGDDVDHVAHDVIDVMRGTAGAVMSGRLPVTSDPARVAACIGASGRLHASVARACRHHIPEPGMRRFRRRLPISYAIHPRARRVGASFPGGTS